MSQQEVVFEVSDFVAVFNQTISFAYPSVSIVGELANFRISKNRWVYFDLKDENSSVKFFGTIYQLNGPLEEGMMLTVMGTPQLHNLYGFSVTVQNIQLSGEGTIKRAAQLLEAKLQKEGLFDLGRKRPLPYPPCSIGLITSSESAGFVDFMKILGERWGGLEINLYDTQVQGENAPAQIIEAIEYFNSHAQPPEVLVITRGGGSADDLQAYSTELVVRAVAASRIPTLVAVGHEVDSSLAELAADYRASTPSNAAQVLTPDKTDIAQQLAADLRHAEQTVWQVLQEKKLALQTALQAVRTQLAHDLKTEKQNIANIQRLLELLRPEAILKRGYAIVRHEGKIVRSVKKISKGTNIEVQLNDGSITAITKDKVQ